MATPPGKPVPFYNRYRKIPGDRKGRYYDNSTGTVVSRYRGQTAMAQAYGFASLDDYYNFSRLFPAGLGGLTGLNPSDVKRSKRLIEDYAKEFGISVNRVTFQNPRLMNVTQIFIESEGRRKGEALNIMLDMLGLRSYTPGHLPGETLRKKH